MSDVTIIDPKDPAHRQRAYRLRARTKKGETLEPDDVGFLAAYEAAQARGASASRKVTYSEEEHAAVGTGSAAEIAAAGMLAREEGRRIDYLATVGIKALVEACGMYRDMTQQLLERTMHQDQVHMEILGTAREHFIHRTEAEVALMKSEAERQDEQGVEQQLGAILAQRLLTPPKPSRQPTSDPKHRNRRGAKSR